jgi:hypothetical protein
MKSQVNGKIWMTPGESGMETESESLRTIQEHVKTRDFSAQTSDAPSAQGPKYSPIGMGDCPK